MRQEDYISEVRSHVRTLVKAVNDLQALQGESTALDYGSTLPDGEGINQGITRDEVTAVVHTTLNAIQGILAQGHYTNLAKLL